MPCSVWIDSLPVILLRGLSKLSNSEWNRELGNGFLMIVFDNNGDDDLTAFANVFSSSKEKSYDSRCPNWFRRVMSDLLRNKWCKYITNFICLGSFQVPLVDAWQMSWATNCTSLWVCKLVDVSLPQIIWDKSLFRTSGISGSSRSSGTGGHFRSGDLLWDSAIMWWSVVPIFKLTDRGSF